MSPTIDDGTIKILVGGNSCQVIHTMYVISGKMHVRMDDGTGRYFSMGILDMKRIEDLPIRLGIDGEGFFQNISA